MDVGSRETQLSSFKLKYISLYNFKNMGADQVMCIIIGELVSSWKLVGVVEFFSLGCIVSIGHICSECCALT